MSAQEGRTAPQNHVIQVGFESATDRPDPFNQVELDAIFTAPDGAECRVPAFWRGGRAWAIRYSSSVVGEHRYRTECSDAADTGLHGVTGAVTVTPYDGDNPLYRHGPVVVAPDHRHFAHEDGTPFLWLGDTWWMGLCNRLHWPEDFHTLTADRVAKGFTVIQIVAGLYPDMPAFDERGANEAGFPWEADYARIRPEYFDMADRRLQYLADQGLTPCLVGAWGYFSPWMGVEKLGKHWRYLVARYGALPIVWCVAGEANLPWYLAPGFPYDDREQVHQWTEVARYLKRIDPYHRPLSIHPTGLGRLSARGAIDDPALLDFDMLQTGHGGREVLEPSIKTLRWSYESEPRMPVLNSEVCYEQLLGWIPADVQRLIFWASMLSGAAGQTYGANGIWQVNRSDQPHGASPHGGNYGTIPWDESMNLPGSSQLALAKRLLERYPWQRFEPHPEWATYDEEDSLGLDGCRWIWFPEGSPVEDAPVERRYFRATFDLPEGQTAAAATLRMSADDACVAYINGDEVGEARSWRTGAQIGGLAARLRPGRNVLAIRAENGQAPVEKNPAGLVACLEIRLRNGEVRRIESSSEWRCAKSEAPGWAANDFDDTAFEAAMELGPYGMVPWGTLADHSPYEVPYAAGIPGEVRFIYVPQQRAATVHGLEDGVTYSARCVDPVSGAETQLGPITATDGSWTCEPPGGEATDWLLVLEAGGSTGGREREALLENESAAWRIVWTDGEPRTTAMANRLTSATFAFAAARELALTISAATDRVAEPLRTVDDFSIVDVAQPSPEGAEVRVRSPSTSLEATLHYQLDGPTRRKWATIRNGGDQPLLLLDVRLDDLSTGADVSGGGRGWPLFLAGQAFATLEHPAGENLSASGRITLTHYPGKLLAPGEAYETRASLISVAGASQAETHFVDYLDAHAVRKRGAVSVYTPFGINNQWGPCPTLTDEEALDVLGVLEGWRGRGVRFDHFTLDTGWPDPSSDMTRFRPWAYPDGPGAIIERVHELGMEFGLWFATGWAAESCWANSAAWGPQQRPTMRYKNGAPDKAGFTGSFCYGTETYSRLVRDAVLHHVRGNGVRFVKFDGGNYACDVTTHGHLPGKYATERMYDSLIDLAEAVRAEAPDAFVMWYWGLGSPLWVLYGDTVFESGLFMEGSGTSSTPTLYYRDSVTLAQDQNAHHARLIPPRCKDSLGVWLADTRWGNYMGKERWREALVMDLGRGSLLFPNLWGDVYLLDDADVDFLAWISKLAKENEKAFLHRRQVGGDPARNDPYGYAHFAGGRGYLFLNNAHFAARPIHLEPGAALGLTAVAGTPLRITSLFPERARVTLADGAEARAGEGFDLWLRPFEVLMLEVEAGKHGAPDLAVRACATARDEGLGDQLALIPVDGRGDAIEFTDAERFRAQGFEQRTATFRVRLPDLAGPQPILAVPVRLRRDGAEWRHSPCVAEIVQVTSQIGDQQLQLMPVPDARQFGNTQKAGCSWVVYKSRLSREWSAQELQLAVSAWLPPGVTAEPEAWLVKRWWQESSRPTPEGYFTDAPS